ALVGHEREVVLAQVAGAPLELLLGELFTASGCSGGCLVAELAQERRPGVSCQLARVVQAVQLEGVDATGGNSDRILHLRRPPSTVRPAPSLVLLLLARLRKAGPVACSATAVSGDNLTAGCLCTGSYYSVTENKTWCWCSTCPAAVRS